MTYTDELIKGTYKQRAKAKNKKEYDNVRIRLMLMRMKMGEWTGDIPETCNIDFLELCLLGGMGQFRKIGNSIVNLVTTPNGNLNMYGYPVALWGNTLNGKYNKVGLNYIPGGENLFPMMETGTNAVDSVLVKDNYFAYPFMHYIDMYAERIADVQRSIDVIANMLKSPSIVTCSEEDAKKIKSVLEKIDENCPWIVGINAAPYNSMNVLETGAKPEILSELKEYKDELENEYASLCGINSNPSVDKKERLIVPEVNANNNMIDLYVKSAVEERQKACEYIKDFWGINIEYNLRYNTEEVINYDDERNDNSAQTAAGDDAQQG